MASGVNQYSPNVRRWLLRGFACSNTKSVPFGHLEVIDGQLEGHLLRDIAGSHSAERWFGTRCTVRKTAAPRSGTKSGDSQITSSASSAR
jgi:hypothetical protein